MPVAGGMGCECSHARSELLCSFPRGVIEALALECQVTFELYRTYLPKLKRWVKATKMGKRIVID